MDEDAPQEPTQRASTPGDLPAPRPRLKGWRRGLRTLLRVSLVFTLLVPAVLALLYFTRERTLHPLLVRFAPPIARMAGGLELTLGDIDGDWRTGLRVTGFGLEKANGEPLGTLEYAGAAEISIVGDLVGFARDLSRLDLIESLDIKSPVLRLDLTAPAAPSGDSKPARFPILPRVLVTDGDLRVRLASDTLHFEGIELDGRATEAAPLTVKARASAREWSARVAGAVVRDSDASVGFTASIPSGKARGVDLSLTDLRGSWSPEETKISRGDLSVGRNDLSPENVILRSGVEGLEAGGKILFDLRDIEGAYRVANAFRETLDPGASKDTAGWRGELHGTIDLSPMAGQVATGDVSISGEDLEIAGVRLGTVQGFATADARGLHLHKFRATSGEDCKISGSGSLLADGRTLERLKVSIQVDRPESLHATLAPIGGLRAELRLAGDVANPSGSIELQAGTVDLGGEIIRDVSATGTLADGVVDLSRAECKTEYGDAIVSTRIGLPVQGRPLDILVETLRWRRGAATLALRDPVPILMDGGHVKVDGLVLQAGEGWAALTFDSETDEGLALDVQIEGLELDPFASDLAAAGGQRLGALHGSATLRTRSAATQGARGSIDLILDRPLDPAAVPVSAKLKATWDGDRIEFRDIVLETAALQLQVTGEAPLAVSAHPLGPGDVDLQVHLNMHASALSTAPLSAFLGPESMPLVERLSGRAFANIRLNGEWDKLRGTLRLDLEDARLAPAVGHVPRLAEAISGSLRVRLGDTLDLEPSTLSLGKSARAIVEGSLAQSLDATALLRDPVARLDQWKAAAIDVQAQLEFDSLDWVARFLPELRETSGVLTGTGRVTGTADAPMPSGSLVLKDGGARYRGLPPLENAQVEVALEPRQIRIVKADMDIGASPVSIRGTVLQGQGQPRVDATIKGSDVLLARSNDALIRADLDLSLQGRMDALTVSGDVALTGGRVRSPFEFRGLLAGGSKSPHSVRRGVRIPAFGPDTLKLDLSIRTSEPLVLKGRIARGEIRADLQLIGTAAQPTPIGQIFFDPLELAVPAGTIRFPTGLIRLSPDNPDIPRIDLVGTTRLAGYDVTVNVDGDYDAPNVDLSSSPPLAPEDLLLLVLSGQPPSRGGIEAAGQSVALYVAKDLVRGWFSSGGFEDEDKESFLDRLEVTTGRDVSRSGTLTLEATYKLREGFARERDALYVVLERDSYEDYGLGIRFVLRLR